MLTDYPSMSVSLLQLKAAQESEFARCAYAGFLAGYCSEDRAKWARDWAGIYAARARTAYEGLSRA